MLSTKINPELMKRSWSKSCWFWDSLKGINPCLVEIKRSLFSPPSETAQINWLSATTDEWALGRRLNEASVSCNGQNESRSCLTSVSQTSCPALWITDSSPGQTAQDESCILTKSSSSLKCFLAAWTNMQTAYQIKGTLLGVSGWLTHASQGVSVTPLGSNATPATALWDIMTPCVRFCWKHF